MVAISSDIIYFISMSVLTQIIFFLFLRAEKKYWSIYSIAFEIGVFASVFGDEISQIYIEWAGFIITLLTLYLLIKIRIVKSIDGEVLEIKLHRG